MLFQTFAEDLQKLESIASRLEMTRILAEVFLALDTTEIPQACYLLQGQLLPTYESLEFQISVKTVIKALARCSPNAAPKTKASLFDETDWSVNEAAVMADYKKLGDLGTVAFEVLSAVNPTVRLSLLDLYQALRALAQDSGEGSQHRKLDSLVVLLQQLDPMSAKFVIRIILARLRLGFSTMTLLDALSWAMSGGKGEADWLEDAYQRRADIGILAQTYLSHPEASQRQTALTNILVEVGVPIVPALCQRLNSSTEIIDKMQTVLAEPKYDGLRVQIHVNKTKSLSEVAETHIKTFTRNLEDSSEMFPELGRVLELLKCQSCILDAEAIGYNPKTGELLPFQETITRKRKHDIAATAEDVPLRFYIFDIMSLDGESLINKKMRDRKALLKGLFDNNDVIMRTEYLETNDPKELREFHEFQLAQGLEGAVIKQVESAYQSGRKGWSWVKIKEEEGTRGKLNDTIDCVVMGYYAGRGKRTKFGVGAFLVGVLDSDQNLRTLAKIGTGLRDDQFKELIDRCLPLIVTQPPQSYEIAKGLLPDFWVKPGLVVEIAADEITKSPVHTAGVALRFPRLIKFRDDKNWEQATTIKELENIS